MANKTGKYNPFKEWLLWCDKKPKTTATTMASYLRRFEEDLLLKGPSQCMAFSEIHQWLKDIDDGVYPLQQIEKVIEELKKIHETLKNEINAATEDQMSEVELDAQRGWQRAFNAYLRFLVDVTDCFDTAMVTDINPQIGRGGKKAKPDKHYSKRVKLFRCGLHKLLLEKLNLKLIDKTLDAFSESVDVLLGSGGSRNVVATAFLTVNDRYEEFDGIFNWRSIILDGITLNNYPEERNNSHRPSYKIIRHKSYEDNADLMSEIFRKALSLQGEINPDYIEDRIISYKESVSILNKYGSYANSELIYSRVEELSCLIHRYASNFEIAL